MPKNILLALLFTCILMNASIGLTARYKSFTMFSSFFENLESGVDTKLSVRQTQPYQTGVFIKKTPIIVPLYPGAVPNSKKTSEKEKSVVGDDKVLRISKVSVPTLTIFKPAKPNGQAIVICPGGGYAILAFDKEGTKVAEELNRWGVTAFVLKYRLPDIVANVDKSLAPLQDAQQAIRYARQHAKELTINENKIGIMGFSAGGHLASTAATHYDYKADVLNTDTTSVRPDFAILIYPVISFDSTIGHKGSRINLVGTNAPEEKIKFFQVNCKYLLQLHLHFSYMRVMMAQYQ